MRLYSAVELTSRACKLFRHHLCADSPDLNTATGLLCSSQVEQDASSLDDSSEDDPSDEEAIDVPDCPVTSAISDQEDVV